MKKIKLLIAFCFGIITLTSCSKQIVFPVSQITPAAEASVKINKDKNNNYNISLTTSYLASPERLTPSKYVYVVWIDTEESGTINVGSLVSSAKTKAVIKFVTPFKPVRIFISAEDRPDVKLPSSTVVLMSEKF